jgi:PPP family 3-phenylpropionic acid transporter
MTIESHVVVARQSAARRFSLSVGLFYGTTLGLVGTYLPFFPVWLTAVGVDASWIGIITAVPSFARFTTLPALTAFAERHRVIRGAIVLSVVLTMIGFSVLGLLGSPLSILIVFGLTALVWTPIGPLTDGYTLKGVAHYGLDYGPLRLWGSAAFVVGALLCGLLLNVIAARHLIWIIVGVAVLSVMVSLSLRPLAEGAIASSVRLMRAVALLRQPHFLSIIAAAALIQGSHAAYYGFASITWQRAGLDGLTIASLWSLGVVAEIIVFALSPRFRGACSLLMLIGAIGAMLRWTMTAQEPPLAVLAVVQLMHGLSFGMTHLGTVGLLSRIVPHHVLASAQGYLVAAIGMITTLTMIASGLFYARYGQNVYYAMAAMAAAGGFLVIAARARFA